MTTTMKKLDAELDKLFGPRPHPQAEGAAKHPREIAEIQISQAIEIGLEESRPPVERGQLTLNEGIKIWEALTGALRHGRGFYQIGATNPQKVYLEVGELANVVSGVIAKSRAAPVPER